MNNIFLAQSIKIKDYENQQKEEKPSYLNVNKDQEENILQNVQLLQQMFQYKNEGDRNLLNKWFQDSVKNYIMEASAAPLLRSQMQLSQVKQIKKLVHSNLQTDIPKYMSILKGYYQLIFKYNIQAPFAQKLQKVINLSPVILSSQSTLNYSIEKEIRKRFVCLLLLRYLEYSPKQEIPSFYELWNLTFPKNKLIKKKMSKFDAKKNVKSQLDIDNNNTSIHQEDLLIPQNEQEQISKTGATPFDYQFSVKQKHLIKCLTPQELNLSSSFPHKFNELQIMNLESKESQQTKADMKQLEKGINLVQSADKSQLDTLMKLEHQDANDQNTENYQIIIPSKNYALYLKNLPLNQHNLQTLHEPDFSQNEQSTSIPSHQVKLEFSSLPLDKFQVKQEEPCSTKTPLGQAASQESQDNNTNDKCAKIPIPEPIILNHDSDLSAPPSKQEEFQQKQNQSKTQQSCKQEEFNESSQNPQLQLKQQQTPSQISQTPEKNQQQQYQHNLPQYPQYNQQYQHPLPRTAPEILQPKQSQHQQQLLWNQQNNEGQGLNQVSDSPPSTLPLNYQFTPHNYSNGSQGYAPHPNSKQYPQQYPYENPPFNYPPPSPQYPHNLQSFPQPHPHYLPQSYPCPCRLLFPQQHDLFGVCPFENQMAPPPPCDHCGHHSALQFEYYSHYLQMKQQHRKQAAYFLQQQSAQQHHRRQQPVLQESNRQIPQQIDSYPTQQMK